MINLLEGTPPLYTTPDKGHTYLTPTETSLLTLSIIFFLIIVFLIFYIAKTKIKLKEITEQKQPKPTPQENVFFCYKCGKEIPKESEFCPHCGTKQNLPK